MTCLTRQHTTLLVLPLLVLGLWLVNCEGQEFTQFRGVGGKGVVDAQLEDDFSIKENLVWKTPIAGGGWSQPVVWNNRIYLTTAVAENGLKPMNFASSVRMPQSMGMGAKAPDFKVEWKIICLNETDGKQLWEKTVASGKPKFGVHPSNTFATETPAVDKDGVYAYFGAAGIVVGLDHKGNPKWERKLGVYKTGNDFGTGSSIVIGKNRVFVQNFSEETADVYCFDTASGSEIWKTSRDTKKTSWSTPVLWKNDKRTELICSGNMSVNSYNPENGEALWTVRKVKAATACSICADDQHIYFGGSDPMSKGPFFAIEPGGKGDIEPKRTNQSFESCKWRQTRAAPGMATPVSNGKYVYIADRSILRCLSAETGEKIYEQRLKGLKLSVACPTIIGDNLVMVDEEGTVGVIKVGKEFSMKIAGKLDDTVWACMGATKDSLLIRGVDNLYRIKFKK